MGLKADSASFTQKASREAPLPQHQTSGHTHVVALCTLEEKLLIGGVFKNVQGRIKVVTRDISSKRLNQIAESLREQRGFLFVDEKREGRP